MDKRFFAAVAFIFASHSLLALELEKAVQVQNEMAYIYENPSLESHLIRRLFLGEIVFAVSQVKNHSGQLWIKVKLSKDKFGYIPQSKLTSSANLPKSIWRSPRVVRHDLPLSVALRSRGELFGYGLQIRHMSFSRLGLSFSVGATIDKGVMVGTTKSFGVVLIPAYSNFSPLVEAGLGNLSYHNGDATLRLDTVFLTVGFEWMLDFGMFVDVGATYSRSLDIEVSYEYEAYRRGDLQQAEFGMFQQYGEQGTLQAVTPMINFGYAF